MSNAIDQALAKADEQAANTNNNAVSNNTYDAPARKLTVDDALEDKGGSTDGYMKVKTTGLVVEGEKVQKLNARFRADDQTICKVYRYGNPPTYVKTYDGRTSTDGRSWAEVGQMASRAEGKEVRDYTSYDLVIVLDETVGAKEAGDRIGYSSPFSALAPLNDLFKTARSQGISDSEYFDAKVGYITKESKQGSDYGIITVEFIGKSKDQS